MNTYRPGLGAICAALALLCCALVPARALADPDPRAIMKGARDNLRVSGSEMVAELSNIDASGARRSQTLAMVSRLEGDSEKLLIRFVAPADVKGTGLLSVDHEEGAPDVWFYLPALRKTRRISGARRKRSFMGSEFSYADITPSPLDDFEFELLGSKTVGGVPCWSVAARPKTPDIAKANGFHRQVAAVSKADHVVLEALFYGEEGKELKRMTAKDVRDTDPKAKKKRPWTVRMEHLPSGRSSVMSIQNYRLRPDVPAEYFTERYLERP